MAKQGQGGQISPLFHEGGQDGQVINLALLPRWVAGFQAAEAKLVLVGLLQRFRFETAPETAVTLQPSITLRPRDGVRLRLAEPQPASGA